MKSLLLYVSFSIISVTTFAQAEPKARPIPKELVTQPKTPYVKKTEPKPKDILEPKAHTKPNELRVKEQQKHTIKSTPTKKVDPKYQKAPAKTAKK